MKLRAEVEHFGRQLLHTQDLDPAYVALAKLRCGGLDSVTQFRLLLAYWCFYNLRTAVRLCAGSGAITEANYWRGMMTAAENVDRSWARGSERRHYRAKNAIDSIADISRRSASGLVKYWCKGPSRVDQVMFRVQGSVGFGPWIAFKIADMAERVLGEQIDFSDFDLSIYSEPRRGAALVATGDGDAKFTADDLRNVVHELIYVFRDEPAPPFGDRPVGVQEVETILCKFKAHRNGHYPLWKDTNELRHSLQGSPLDRRRDKIVAQLLEHLPSSQ